jgi:hypothetical protein
MIGIWSGTILAGVPWRGGGSGNRNSGCNIRVVGQWNCSIYLTNAHSEIGPSLLLTTIVIFSNYIYTHY